MSERDKIKCLLAATCSVCSDPCVEEELARAKAERDEAWKALKHQGALLDKVTAGAAAIRLAYEAYLQSKSTLETVTAQAKIYSAISTSTAGQDFLSERTADKEIIAKLEKENAELKQLYQLSHRKL